MVLGINSGFRLKFSEIIPEVFCVQIQVKNRLKFYLKSGQNSPSIIRKKVYLCSEVQAHYNPCGVVRKGKPLTRPVAPVKKKQRKMAKTSIHVTPAKSSSEVHNHREKELDYVRKDLTNLNESFEICAIAERLAQKKTAYENTVGQKMQAKSTPIREGVIVISEETSMQQLKDYAAKCQQRFGIEAIQIHIHKDEGHWKDDVWKPNLHAHMVFDWTAENGKSIKLKRTDVAEMQTILAESLGMERGLSSDRKHLKSLQYKTKLIEETKKQLDKELAQMNGKKNDLEAEISTLNETMASVQKNYLGYIKKEPLIDENKRLIDGIKAARKERDKFEASANNYKERYEMHYEDNLKKASRIKNLEDQLEKAPIAIFNGVNNGLEKNGIDIRFARTPEQKYTIVKAEHYKGIQEGKLEIIMNNEGKPELKRVEIKPKLEVPSADQLRNRDRGRDNGPKFSM